jgi:hypothetical protein
LDCFVAPLLAMTALGAITVIVRLTEIGDQQMCRTGEVKCTVP